MISSFGRGFDSLQLHSVIHRKGQSAGLSFLLFSCLELTLTVTLTLTVCLAVFISHENHRIHRTALALLVLSLRMAVIVNL